MFRFRLVNTITDLLVTLSFVVFTLGVTLLGPSPLALAESSKALARFALVDVTRDPGGNPELTPEGQLVSSNWSGYVLPNFQTGDVYTSVQATWAVPEVPYENKKHDSTEWIGIGGFCKDPTCRKIDQTLIRVGTGQDPLGGPENVYFSWYQMSPGVVFGGPIGPHPGDEITASLSCNPCTGSQTWTVSMVDTTTGESWTEDFSYQSSELSAEIVEGTSTDQRGIFPLANYGIATFDQSSVNGGSADLSVGYSIVLREPQHKSSIVSTLDSTFDGFSACFESRKRVAPCLFMPLPGALSGLTFY